MRRGWREATSALFVDPLGFEAGDSNLYRYVGNRPTNSFDPNGLLTVLVHGVNSAASWYEGFASGLISFAYSKKNVNAADRVPMVIGFLWKTDTDRKAGLLNANNDPEKLDDTSSKKGEKRAYQNDRATSLKSLVNDLRIFLDSSGHKEEPINIIAHS